MEFQELRWAEDRPRSRQMDDVLNNWEGWVSHPGGGRRETESCGEVLLWRPRHSKDCSAMDVCIFIYSFYEAIIIRYLMFYLYVLFEHLFSKHIITSTNRSNSICRLMYSRGSWKASKNNNLNLTKTPAEQTEFERWKKSS